MEASRRVFEAKNVNGESVKLAIVQPTQEDMDDADLVYTSAFSKAIKLGTMTNSQLIDEIKKLGSWSEEEEKEIESLRSSISIKLNLLEDKALPKEKQRKFAREVQELRGKLFEKITKFHQFISNSAESYANKIKNNYLTSVCVVYDETNEKYFKDYNDFKTRRNDPVLIEARVKMEYFLLNAEDNFMNNFEELKY